MPWRYRAQTLLACGLALGLAAVAAAQDDPPESLIPHQIPKTDSPVTVDGMLDETAWQTAWSLELDYEVWPGENVTPPVRTVVLVTYDAEHLYVAFRAHDPKPSAIRAHLTDRDDAWNDDRVGVVLDTFNDQRRNYLLLINPLGVQMDLIEAWPDGEEGWDGIWDSAGKITDWGWVAELKIPFSSLRFQRGDGGQIWGFDAIRWYPRRETHKMTVFPRDRSNNCYLCQAIKIEGFSDATPGRNLEITPTVTAVRTETRRDFPHGELEDDGSDEEAGITARWGITPNLTLGTTIHPDFSQVEADSLQLDINEPFALFFAEKRPFFMEAADFFNTRFDAVYTRTLRDPSWGVALTGKEGANTVGAYVVRDDVTNLIFPGNQRSSGTSLRMASTAAVARYKRDLGDRYTLGLLVTNREGDEYANRVAGVDGDFRLSSKDRIRFQLLGSSTEYPDEVAAEFEQPLDDLNDWAADFRYSHETRTYSFWGGYRDVGAEFRADLGFMPRVDFRSYYAGSGYDWNAKEDSWFSRLALSGEYQYEVDHNGDLLNRETEVSFTYEGPPLQSHSALTWETSREAFNGVEFDLSSLFLHQCMNPNGHSHVWLNLDLGDQIDYANTRLGERIRLHPGFDYRLGRHLRFELWHTFERMEVESERLYTANISQLTLAYHFSARTFLRSIVQNVDYEYNTALYVDDRDSEYKRVFTQLLFSYKVNPQTVLFIGYSDNHLGNQDIGLTRSDRTFFAKIGYAWTP